jgi:ankyrin repeat protein
MRSNYPLVAIILCLLWDFTSCTKQEEPRKANEPPPIVEYEKSTSDTAPEPVSDDIPGFLFLDLSREWASKFSDVTEYSRRLKEELKARLNGDRSPTADEVKEFLDYLVKTGSGVLIPDFIQLNPNVYREYLDGYFLEAVRSQDEKLVTWLLEAGADVNASAEGIKSDNLPRTALDLALDGESPDSLITLLLAYGCVSGKVKSNRHEYRYTAHRWGAMRSYTEDVAIPARDVNAIRNSRPQTALIRSIGFDSFLQYDEDMFLYHPVKMFDGRPETAWLDGSPGSGIGEKIVLRLNREIAVDEIGIAPGYFDKQWFKDNNRIRSMKITAGGDDYTCSFKDEMSVKRFRLGKEIKVDRFVFTIEEVYRADKSDDTAISEIEFFLKGKKVRLFAAKAAKYLDKVSRNSALAIVQQNVDAAAYASYKPSGASDPAQQKYPLAPTNISLINRLSGFPDNTVTWNDANGNGMAEINELTCFDEVALGSFWAMSRAVPEDNALSSDDYGLTLLTAIEQDAKKMYDLLLQGDVNWQYVRKGFGYLHAAAATGNLPLLELALGKGVGLNAAAADGATALHIALKNKRDDAARWLIDKGADMLTPCYEYRSPAMLAISLNRPDILSWMVDKGLNVNGKGCSGHLLLGEAVLCRNVDIVKYLLEKGADINGKDDGGRTALIWAVRNDNPSMVNLIADRGGGINDSDNEGMTPLLEAVQSRGSDIARFFIDRGAMLTAKNNAGQNALHLAAKSANAEMVKYFLDKGFDPMAMDARGDYAVSLLYQNAGNLYGRQNDVASVLKALIKSGCKAKVSDKDGKSLLVYAVEHDWGDTVKILLESKTYTPADFANGESPLFTAIEHEAVSALSALLGGGFPAKVKNNQGLTPALLILPNHSIELLDALLAHKPDLKTRTSDGMSVLDLLDQEIQGMMMNAAMAEDTGSDESAREMRDKAAELKQYRAMLKKAGAE